jgi:hypothetical protein
MRWSLFLQIPVSEFPVWLAGTLSSNPFEGALGRCCGGDPVWIKPEAAAGVAIRKRAGCGVEDKLASGHAHSGVSFSFEPRDGGGTH